MNTEQLQQLREKVEDAPYRDVAGAVVLQLLEYIQRLESQLAACKQSDYVSKWNGKQDTEFHRGEE